MKKTRFTPPPVIVGRLTNNFRNQFPTSPSGVNNSNSSSDPVARHETPNINFQSVGLIR